jgi:hypothetical protein
MLVERVLRRVDELVYIALEGRHPERIVLVEAVRKIDEFLLIPARANRLNPDRFGFRGQIRSMSRPTRWNASSTKSSCASV